jgi:hypothetical protein
MRISPLLLVAALSAAPANAQISPPLKISPLTGEILISVSDVTSRLRPGVAADRAGRFVVVWREIDGQDGGISGRPLSAAGAPSGPGFVVEPRDDRRHTTDPRVVVRADGGFLVAWGEAAFPRPGCPRARAFLPGNPGSGLAAGDVFDLGPCAAENGRDPHVALAGLPDGRFTAAWETGQALSASGFDVVVRPFAAPGEPLSDPRRVDDPGEETGRIGDQTAPAVAVGATGRAFALWHEDGQAALIGRCFDPAGQPLGAPFRVDGGLGFPVQAAVASSLSGRFVAVWSAFTGQETRIFAQIFDAMGRKKGGAVPVSLSQGTAPQDPGIALDAAGDFIVVWDAQQVDGSGTAVLGRLFDPDGRPQGPPFRINVTARGSQGHPAVAFTRGGRLLVVWDSQKDAGARGSIVGRLYMLTRPVLP